MNKLKVYLVYFSYIAMGAGLCGEDYLTKPEIVGAFRYPDDAAKWIKKERRKLKANNSRGRFTRKTLLVS